jgi:hypothetical protein
VSDEHYQSAMDMIFAAELARNERIRGAKANGFDHDADGFDQHADAADDMAEQDPEACKPSATPWPAPLGEAAYLGIAGDFVSLIGPHSEADPAALMFQLLAYAGNVFGNKAFYAVEDTRHHPNLYVTLVGDTASARKGTSRKRINKLAQLGVPEWEAQCTVSGLSTGEGLIARVCDPVYGPNKKGELELVHPGAKDKRLLVVEEEFSRPLRVMERSNNTLAAVLRQAWDGDRLSILTRENPIKATGAIVSIIGHITVSELKADLTEVNTANGFGNRFLWPLVRKSKSLPFGGEDCTGVITELAVRLRQAVERSPNGVVRFDELARHRWAEVYESLNQDNPGLYGAMTARTAPQVIRIALIYALLDQQHLLGLDHLAAALEVVRYSNDSVRHIFGDTTGNNVADTILKALRASPEGMTC